MATSEDEPHEQWRGTLRSGNPSGDWTTAARCGAMNRQHTLQVSSDEELVDREDGGLMSLFFI